jgi:hypothetical protein
MQTARLHPTLGAMQTARLHPLAGAVCRALQEQTFNEQNLSRGFFLQNIIKDLSTKHEVCESHNVRSFKLIQAK